MSAMFAYKTTGDTTTYSSKEASLAFLWYSLRTSRAWWTLIGRVPVSGLP